MAKMMSELTFECRCMHRFYFRLLSYSLAHNSVPHMLNNTSILLLVGPSLETTLGVRVMIKNMILTSVIGGLTNACFYNYGLIGSSGVMFMFILVSSFGQGDKRRECHSGEIPVTFVATCLLYFGKELWAAWSATDDVSHVAHLVGGACGAVIGWASREKAPLRYSSGLSS